MKFDPNPRKKPRKKPLDFLIKIWYTCNMLNPAQIKDFWSQVICQADDVCWLWDGPIQPMGGAPEFAYRLSDAMTVVTRKARGVAYQLAFGWGSIPSGSYVYSTCGNNLCVNPFHLKLGHTIVNDDGLTKAQCEALERFQGSINRQRLDDTSL